MCQIEQYSSSEIEITEMDKCIAHFEEECCGFYTRQNDKARMYHTTLGILSVLSNVRRCIVTVCFKAYHSHWHTDPTRKSLGPKGPDAAGGQDGPAPCQTGVSPPSERRVLYMPRRRGIYRARSERGGETQVWREGGPILFFAYSPSILQNFANIEYIERSKSNIYQ